MTADRMRVVLTGASYATGNLGVSALAEATLQGILDQDPDACISIVDMCVRESGKAVFHHRGRDVLIPVLSVRYSKNLFQSNHILNLIARAFFWRLVPLPGWRARLLSGNPVLRSLFDADVIADLSGGDSFTDIYGPTRGVCQVLSKLLLLSTTKEVVFLPQTVGPFRSRVGRWLARFALKRARVVYSRDFEGLEDTRRLLGSRSGVRIEYAPDVALLLESKRPGGLEHLGLADEHRSSVLVGVNVNGLLLNGGYSRNNQFGLRLDYRSVVVELLKVLLKESNVSVLLIPHVRTKAGHIEDDLSACESVWHELAEEERMRTVTVRDGFGPGEMRYVIGQCGFFVGSRLHSCIAALSQGIPAVGIAYSRKFRGVFESLGVGALVADPRTMTKREILEIVRQAFQERESIRTGLLESLSAAKAKVRGVFRELLGNGLHS